jgi:two-component system, chemotaxis family, chemotaxis protein CheY
MKVLVVDDSRSMRLIVIRTLRQAGYEHAEVIEAVDGSEGLAAATHHALDLILADWNMPVMTGIDLLRVLRARGDRTVFGLVTSEGSARMRSLAEDAGADFLISKPFTTEGFRDAISAVYVEGGAP